MSQLDMDNIRITLFGIRTWWKCWNTGLGGFQGKIGTEESNSVSGPFDGRCHTMRTLNQDNRFTVGVALDRGCSSKEEEGQLAKEKLLFVNFERFQNNKNLPCNGLQLNRKLESPQMSSAWRMPLIYLALTFLVYFPEHISWKAGLGKQRINLIRTRLLTSSQLFNGWVKHHLSNETSHITILPQASQDNISMGLSSKITDQNKALRRYYWNVENLFSEIKMFKRNFNLFYEVIKAHIYEISPSSITCLCSCMLNLLIWEIFHAFWFSMSCPSPWWRIASMIPIERIESYSIKFKFWVEKILLSTLHYIIIYSFKFR